MSALELYWFLFAAVVTAGVGRVVLAFMPAGHPGGHGTREIAATWASAHVLGLIALRVEERIFGALDVAAGLPTLLLPWVLLAVLRFETLPGAMVPRHATAEELPTRVARLASAATLVVIGVTFYFSAVSGLAPEVDGAMRALLSWSAAGAGPTPMDATSFVALLVLVGRGLATSRRDPVGRRLVVLALAATPNAFDSARESGTLVTVGLLVCAACAFAPAWLRRADRRGRVLAILSFAALPLFEPALVWLAFAGLIALSATTAGPSRRSTATLAFGTFASSLLFLSLADLRVTGSPFRALGAVAESGGSWRIYWLLLIAACGYAIVPRRNALEADHGRIPQPTREATFLGVFLALGLVALGLARLDGTLAAGHTRPVVLIPCAVLLSGLLVLRAERPGNGS